MRLKNIIRKTLTKTVVVQMGTRKKQKRVQVLPSEQIVYLVYFAIAAFVGLIALEIVHMVFFGVWNSEIFSAITGLIGTISGIFVSKRV
ncbi:MAG: hypothetical protein OEY88_10505 [Candidatus Bathyarchaeota archaeon]|nr:hypothetical protein [Candidatus Bathyarchaeota archaeon]